MAATLASTILTGASLLVVTVLAPRGLLAEAWASALLLVGSGWVVGVVADRATRVAQRRLLARLESSVWSGLLEHPVHFFASRPIRELLGFVGSISMVRRLVGPQSLEAVLASVAVGATTVLLTIVDPWLGARAIIVTLGVGAFALQLFRLQQRHDLDVLQAVESAQATLYPALLGRDELEVYSAHDHVRAQWKSSFVRQKDADRAGLRVADAATALLRAIPAIFVAVLCPVALQPGSGLLGLGAMTVVALQLGGAVSRLVPVIPAVFSLTLADRRLQPVLASGSAPTPRSGAGRDAPAPSGPRSGDAGSIVLRDVRFAFPGTPEPILDGASAEIVAGSMVAVIGPSGSGKSTLLHVLLGLAPCSSGGVAIDGVDVTRIPELELRRLTGYVPQGGTLLRGTLREAVTGFRDDVDDDAIVAALARAGLRGLVSDLPMGLDSRITDGRSGFSGGQEQRILLARALVGAPAVLVLDEATSALDSSTESEVSAAVAELRMTRVVVAHRMSTILLADQILLLREGRLSAVRSRDPVELAAIVAASAEPAEPAAPAASLPTPLFHLLGAAP